MSFDQPFGDGQTSPDGRDRARVEGLVDENVGREDGPAEEEVDEVLVLAAVVSARSARKQFPAGTLKSRM